MILPFRYQKVNLRISHQGQRVYFNTETHRDYSFIRALSLSVAHEGALYGSTFGFRVDEKEVFDESHEAHLLVFGPDLAPNKRMLFFEYPIAVNTTRIEGIYTDSGLKALLGSNGDQQSGGVIGRNNVNVKKSYVSGKESIKFSNFSMAANLQTSITLPSPTQQLYYPYDVRIILLLSR